MPSSLPETPPMKVYFFGHEGTELQKFAQVFVQDWKDICPSFIGCARLYAESLSDDQRKILASEFDTFLGEVQAFNDSEILERWIELGAEAWDPDLTIGEGLHLLRKELN